MSTPNQNKTRPINRLILVGNGFDLAHGMKTSYGDFILGYFQKCWEEAFNEHKLDKDRPRFSIYSNPLISFSFDRPSLLLEYNYPKITQIQEIYKLIEYGSTKNTSYTIQVEINSKFFKLILNDLENRKWVDIENLYYEELKKIIKEHQLSTIPQVNSLQTSLNELNDHFDILKKELEAYLCSIVNPSDNDYIHDHIYETPILSNFENFQLKLGDVMMLNFNYTATTEMYKRPDSDIIHIHGELNKKENPIIFGYGDERDETYDLLEKANIPEVFTHIKSFDYFKTDNYSRLLAFLESEFDVYIMGHSCGLSDRTLLSTIFEHKNCRFIKVFYYDNPENYRKTTYEISRHFTDKAEMRKKVLDITKCKPMPQYSKV